MAYKVEMTAEAITNLRKIHTFIGASTIHAANFPYQPATEAEASDVSL